MPRPPCRGLRKPKRNVIESNIRVNLVMIIDTQARLDALPADHDLREAHERYIANAKREIIRWRLTIQRNEALKRLALAAGRPASAVGGALPIPTSNTLDPAAGAASASQQQPPLPSSPCPSWPPSSPCPSGMPLSYTPPRVTSPPPPPSSLLVEIDMG
ncbi:hypothetical protein Hte_002557 [Hypoxylon texense]